MAILRPKSATRPINKKALLIEAAKKSYRELLDLTTTQGLRYSYDPDTNFIYRAFWFISVFGSFILCNYMAIKFYRDFLAAPTTINIESIYAPLQKTQFPAVTICNSKYISLKKTEEFVKKLKLPPNISEESVIANVYQSTGFRMKTAYDLNDLQELQRIVDLNNYTVAEFMSSIRVNCDEMLLRCRWKMEIIDCKELFQKSQTYFGACCSFNINQIGLKYFNEPATISGMNTGLSIIATTSTQDYDLAAHYSHGFKVIVHRNFEYPTEASNERLIALNYEYFIQVRPEEVSCALEAKELFSAAVRNCYFADELRASFFSGYDENNCEIECEISSIVRTCGCVPYYFIPVPSKPVCDFTKIACLVENYDENILRKGTVNSSCSCENTCENIDYEVVASRMPLINTRTAVINPFLSGIDDYTNISIVNIYMADQTYIKRKRVLVVTMIQLVSNMSSTYTLFLGISLISFLEILYFFPVVTRRYYLEALADHEKALNFIQTIDKPKISKFHYPNIKKVQQINEN